jgi:hypothetical protein
MRKGYLDKTHIGKEYSEENKEWVIRHGFLIHDRYDTEEEADAEIKRLRDDDRRVREVYRLLYVHLSQHGFIRFYLDIKSKHKDADQIMEMVREDYLN